MTYRKKNCLRSIEDTVKIVIWIRGEMVREQYPQIIKRDQYYLGKITSDHLLRLDEPDVIDLMVNLSSYSIVRDKYREIVKAGRSG